MIFSDFTSSNGGFLLHWVMYSKVLKGTILFIIHGDPTLSHILDWFHFTTHILSQGCSTTNLIVTHNTHMDKYKTFSFCQPKGFAMYVEFSFVPNFYYHYKKKVYCQIKLTLYIFQVANTFVCAILILKFFIHAQIVFC